MAKIAAKRANKPVYFQRIYFSL